MHLYVTFKQFLQTVTVDKEHIGTIIETSKSFANNYIKIIALKISIINCGILPVFMKSYLFLPGLCSNRIESVAIHIDFLSLWHN